MTDKKKHKHSEDEVEETQAEAVAAPEAGEQAFAEIESLKIKLDETEAKLAESVEGWQRSAAEFQNYRKRIERDNLTLYASMKGDIIKRILPVLDDLERALQKRPADSSWADGIELVVRKLQATLDGEGVKRIPAQGSAFDPNFHEAISHEPSEEVQSGHVIEVVQNGYVLGDRVIRPALVRVAQ